MGYLSTPNPDPSIAAPATSNSERISRLRAMKL
jgi:hypothetical protein